METIRVYVGSDRSQLLAVKVLEYSIKKFTQAPVVVQAMCDLPIPIPKDPRQRQRTGFSFSRFCIPELAGFKGRAIYLDADMIVFKDMLELWNWPFEQHKILIQKPLQDAQANYKKVNAPQKRIRQCAVMVLDCGNLDWDIKKIVQDLDQGTYTYEQLMFDLCLLKNEDIGEILPFEWNSLEHYDTNTRLLHYTDMGTQPWVYPFNKNNYLWLQFVAEMLEKGLLTESEIKEEINLGFFRPSIWSDIKTKKMMPKILWPLMDYLFFLQDKKSGFVKHKQVYEQKKERDNLVRQYTKSLQR